MTGTPWPLVALAAVLGLVVGSFLNVVVHRVPRHESLVSPGSHCPRCDVPIRARHNVPVVGWLVLRGRCAACRNPISLRYPLVEAGTGALFAAVVVRFGITPELPAYLYLAAVGVALTLIQLDVRRLPDSIVLPSYVVCALLLIPAGAADADWADGLRSLAGMSALLALYFTLALAYPIGVVFADAKLAGLLGLALGWLSWDAVFLAAAGSFVIAGISGTAFALTGRNGGHGRAIAVPMVPCLIAAAALAVFVAAPVNHWYGSLLTG